MKKHQALSADLDQLGFDNLLIEAETVNRQAALEKRFGHLPGAMDEALPFYRCIINKHHAAMNAGDAETALRLREEAHNLALRLNNGEPGILAGPDAPGCMLESLTAADDGIVPLWGQTGSFIVEVQGMPVRIEMDGIFGIGAQYSPWMNFSAHAVDWDKAFLSETGYRSFLGLHAELVHGLTPDTFAIDVIALHVARNLKGKAADDRGAIQTVNGELSHPMDSQPRRSAVVCLRPAKRRVFAMEEGKRQKAKRQKKGDFPLDIAMLHLSGLGWVETMQYINERDGCNLSKHEIDILASGLEYTYERVLIKAVRQGLLYV